MKFKQSAVFFIVRKTNYFNFYYTTNYLPYSFLGILNFDDISFFKLLYLETE